MTLYLPIGPPASGKSSFVDLLVSMKWLDPDAVVSPDAYRRILTGDHSCQDDNGLVFDVCEKVVRSRLRHNLDVWYDATNLVESWRANVVGSAQFLGRGIVSVFFDTPDEECLSRNAAREKPVPDGVMAVMLQHRRLIDLQDLPGTVMMADECYFKIMYSHAMPAVGGK